MKYKFKLETVEMLTAAEIGIPVGITMACGNWRLPRRSSREIEVDASTEDEAWNKAFPIADALPFRVRSVRLLK
jgi:hypothetical protein